MAGHLLDSSTSGIQSFCEGKEERFGEGEGGLSSSNPYSSSPPMNSQTANMSSPNSPPDSDGWQKSIKVVHRCLSGVSNGDPSSDGGALPTAFGTLGPLGDSMELGFAEEASPQDMRMVDYGALSLKRGRSPSKPPNSTSCGISSLKVVSSPTDSTSTQVSLSAPCMAGDLGGKGSKDVEVPLLVKESSVPALESISLLVASTTKGVLCEDCKGEGRLVWSRKEVRREFYRGFC